jgi:hypothetical protein
MTIDEVKYLPHDTIALDLRFVANYLHDNDIVLPPTLEYVNLSGAIHIQNPKGLLKLKNLKVVTLVNCISLTPNFVDELQNQFPAIAIDLWGCWQLMHINEIVNKEYFKVLCSLFPERDFSIE